MNLCVLNVHLPRDRRAFSIASDRFVHSNAVWSYETPFAAVAKIKDHLALYPDRVDEIQERPAA